MREHGLTLEMPAETPQTALQFYLEVSSKEFKNSQKSKNETDEFFRFYSVKQHEENVIFENGMLGLFNAFVIVFVISLLSCCHLIAAYQHYYLCFTHVH